MINLQRGGFCYDMKGCLERLEDSPTLMRGMTDTAMQGSTVLSPSEDTNPAFWDYNHVFLPYCTSDLWFADRAADPEAANTVGEGHALTVKQAQHWGSQGVVPFQFRGRPVLTAVIEDLHAELSAASEVVVSGSSAGGIGAIHFTEMLQPQHPQGTVKAVLDSAWFAELAALDTIRGNSKYGTVPGTSIANIFNATAATISCIADAACSTRSLKPDRVSSS